MVRYKIFCDTIYNAVRDMAIYEIARYMRSGDVQNVLIKRTLDTICVERLHMGRYEKWEDTRCGTKYDDMRDVRYAMWSYTTSGVN